MFKMFTKLKTSFGVIKHLAQAPAATGTHNACFQRVQDDMNKARSVNKDWEFVSKGTEISLGRFVSEYFTPLILSSRMSVVSTEDTVTQIRFGGRLRRKRCRRSGEG
jgi:hypothetical protein